MKRAVLAAALAASGCLSTGASPLAPLDTTPPTLIAFTPDLGPDAGLPDLPVAGSIQLTFSEAMDPTSLRPGLAVRRKDEGEQALTLVAPEVPPSVADRDQPYTVTLSAASPQGFALGVSRLIVRDLLLDAQGNALALEEDQPEVTYFFNVR